MAAETSSDSDLRIYSTQSSQVGDGFFIQRALPLPGKGIDLLEPFLVLDHAGPTRFEPTTRPRGVSAHPHAGFQTVTLVYQGEIRHRDSTNRIGTIGPGDVQWMTAGSGVVHEEMHGPNLMKNGGTLELIQLWVNLPAHRKQMAPHYRDLRSGDFQMIPLAEDGPHHLRLIAGKYGTYTGPGDAYSPMLIADLYTGVGADVEVTLTENWNTGVYCLRGAATINGEHIKQNQFAHLDKAGVLAVATQEGAHLLLLSAEPIGEPIVAEGPFVMTTQADLRAAVNRHHEGLMGRLH